MEPMVFFFRFQRSQHENTAQNSFHLPVCKTNTHWLHWTKHSGGPTMADKRESVCAEVVGRRPPGSGLPAAPEKVNFRAAPRALGKAWNHRCALWGPALLHWRQQLLSAASICGNSAWKASTSKRATEALLTPDKIDGREVKGEERDAARARAQTRVCVCVCARTCVCIFRGLNCGCKTLMILCPFCPLTKWPARRSAGPHTSNAANHPMRLRTICNHNA